MMYLNSKEEKIIGKCIEVIDDYNQKEMLLKWDNTNIAYGIYDTYIEDENDFDMDSDEYEEFWSFVFKVIEVIGNPPIYVTEDKYFMINYHNFPDEILVDGKKIN